VTLLLEPETKPEAVSNRTTPVRPFGTAILKIKKALRSLAIFAYELLTGPF
jgi:hypothetical protein